MDDPNEFEEGEPQPTFQEGDEVMYDFVDGESAETLVDYDQEEAEVLEAFEDCGESMVHIGFYDGNEAVVPAKHLMLLTSAQQADDEDEED